MKNVADVTTWRGSPWFFIGWQLALCATAVLVALLRGAEGRVRFRVTRTLQIVLALAAIMFVLAAENRPGHQRTRLPRPAPRPGKPPGTVGGHTGMHARLGGPRQARDTPPARPVRGRP
jgi:hypothetical protein